ncbi:MAG TPA: aminoglycoside phosphotransferase family protein [Phycisphaerae bacterium]|nr:aminoglycoside phosphotransferase family protein [Phycisphaerae bacterium]
MTSAAVLEAARQFACEGRLTGVRRLPGGHIHESYHVRAEGGAVPGYVLQRLNTRVFREPLRLMENVARVTRHVQAGLRAAGVADVRRRVLHVVPTRDGRLAWPQEVPTGADVGEAGEAVWWRMFEFIDGATTRLVVRGTRQAEQVACAFGEFQAQLSDLPPPPLHETIADFHDTRARLEQLRRAAEADLLGRARQCRAELAQVERRAELAGALGGAGCAPALPRRAVHNDAKISNVLFDAADGSALCIVDLDTVMPGLALHDFGDMVRSMATPAGEDETELERVAVRPDYLEALRRGYLAAASAFLSDAERALLPLAGPVIAFEQAVRFLADHLVGDAYYRTTCQFQNLSRARNQLALLESLLQVPWPT